MYTYATIATTFECLNAFRNHRKTQKEQKDRCIPLDKRDKPAQQR